MIDQFRQAFKDESYELLAQLESSLLELEETPENRELVGSVFRCLHTIKGSGGMFGFGNIQRFTHEVETVFELVRNGDLDITNEIVSLSLNAKDRIKAMLDANDADNDVAASKELIARFRQIAETGEPQLQSKPLSISEPTQNCKSSEEVTYHILFKPSPCIFRSGMNPLTLLNELRTLGICTVVSQVEAIPTMYDLDPESCYIYWDIILTTSFDVNAIYDVFIFIADGCELKVTAISDLVELEQILVERGDLTVEDIQPVTDFKPSADAGIKIESNMTPKLVEQHARSDRQERQNSEVQSSIRVPAEKLDQLVNLVGEMVTVQARLSQTASLQMNCEFLSIAEEVERLTNDLRDMSLDIRMLPIGSTFSKFKRLVRDLSQELGKEIEMITSGADTELDKTVIERLNDPLVHLIRNSIDHGIETPETRRAAGKPLRGTVHLGAVHSGDSVLITIHDDGAGLDRESIYAKAVERGLIAENAELTDKEVYNQIFVPGFSTAAKVTSVSGRGVGMDVVKKAIEALRGSIDITSVRGEGSTITLRIPLTLAIVESLLVRIDRSFFLMPLAIVEQCIELSRDDIKGFNGRNLANVRGDIVPYITLREQFEIGGGRPDIEQIVITHINGNKVGFVVDSVIGEHQTVIKTLGRMYRDVRGISGATIMGDGTVALILDMGEMLRIAEKLEQR